MKRSSVSLAHVADWDNLVRALYLAARGKRDRPRVRRFLRCWPHQLRDLQAGLLRGSPRFGPVHRFRIRDPKPRLIHAPSFRERVLHHGIMRQIGPVLERSLVADTYACRAGKGPLRAVTRLQRHLRRYPWFVKIDTKDYFASIDHDILLRLLARRFKDAGLLALIERILASHQPRPGKGLPIGALTSQHFANFYLGVLDRWLLEEQRVGGMVRYMDDVIWMEATREAAKSRLRTAEEFLKDSLALEIKSSAQVNRSSHGVTFLGYRVLRGALLLSARRRRLYSAARKRWERAFLRGEVTAVQLQQGMDSALSLTAHADPEDAGKWRREQLQRGPLDASLVEL